MKGLNRTMSLGLSRQRKPVERRRTKAEMERLERGIVELVNQHRPLTVRHLFYLAVAAGLIEKTETEYRSVIIRIAGELRERWLRWQKQTTNWRARMASGDIFGLIPFGDEYMVDGGRWVQKPATYETVEEALQTAAQSYQRAVWTDLPIRVHLFCEKDAISNLIYPITARYDVPLCPMRGDASKTFLWERAEAIVAAAKPVILYFLGDYDTKGYDIIRSAVDRIQRYAPEAEIEWEILALTAEQVEQYNLPTPA
jgi:hypothetical protein